MATLAIANLHNVDIGPAIVEYLERIDETLAPYGGEFVVHGQTAETVEGSWAGNLVIIQFPDRQRARDWYASSAYQAILRLRTEHAQSDVVLIDTVGSGYRARDFAKKLTSHAGA